MNKQHQEFHLTAGSLYSSAPLLHHSLLILLVEVHLCLISSKQLPKASQIFIQQACMSDHLPYIHLVARDKTPTCHINWKGNKISRSCLQLVSAAPELIEKQLHV